MNNKLGAIFAVVVLLLVSHAQVVEAWHTIPQTPGMPGAPELPEDPPKTGVLPVDRELEDATAPIQDLNEGIGTVYRVIGETLNDVEDAIDGTAQLPLTLYRDGTGGFMDDDPRHPDARDGGFGDWQKLGTPNVWATREEAAFQGGDARSEVRVGSFQVGIETGGDRRSVSGYTSANLERPDGPPIYPGGATSLLVTPEIDLRTNPLQDGRTGVGGSIIYRLLVSACDTGFSTPSGDSLSEVEEVPQCDMYRALMDMEGLATMEYSVRHNLATSGQSVARDGVVVMVFTEPPTMETAQNCVPRQVIDLTSPLQLPPCQIAVPNVDYSNVDLLPGGRGYTGYREWERHAIDLTPWMNGTVWVGFYFASGSIVSPLYFNSEERFNQDAGFYGFQLDDLKTEALAAPVNLGVRPLLEPSFNPNPDRYDAPRLHPDDSVPVFAHVTNFGATVVDFQAVARILDHNRDPLGEEWEAWTKRITLPPGAAWPVSAVFPSPGEGEGYIAQVCVYRVVEDVPDVDAGGSMPGEGEEFCEDPGRDACSGDSLEANPCNRVMELVFDMLLVRDIRTGVIERSENSILDGENMIMSMPIWNQGNVPESVRVEACMVKLDDPEQCSTQMVAAVPSQLDEDGLLHLDPLQEELLQWTIEAGSGRDGQYRLFVRMGDAPGFDSRYDLLPSILRPWDSTPFPAHVEDSPALQSDRKWLDILDFSHPLGGGVSALAGNSESNLYLRLNGIPQNSNGLTLFFNDNNDGDINSGGGGIGLRLNSEGEPTGIRYQDGWRLFPAGTNVREISAGVQHSLAVTVGGEVYAWGRAEGGRLGTGNTADQASPVLVTGELEGQAVIAVSAWWEHSLALTEDGEVFSWGPLGGNSPGDGRLCAGDRLTNAPTPIRAFNGFTNVTAISAGAFHSLALTQEGRVFACGRNNQGQLGIGETGDVQTSPVRVHGLENVIAISAGDSHSLALTDDGKVFAWGVGSDGRLGLGNQIRQPAPLPVVGLNDETVVAISAGFAHSLALTDDGRVYAWGLGDDGLLGTGDEMSRNVPTPVTGLDHKTIVSVSAGGGHSLALAGDGAVYAWGSGAHGRLGTGATGSSSVPVRVVESVDAGAWEGREIFAGGSHSFAMTQDNMVLAWGQGGNGRLGYGVSSNSLVPRLTLTEETFTTFGDWDVGIEVSVGQSSSDPHEFIIPINRTGMEGLTVGPGESLGTMIRLCANLGRLPCDVQFPASASVYDGGGFHRSDGTMENELRLWQTIRMADPSILDGSIDALPFAATAIGPGLGVNMVPPPYFLENLEQAGACPSLVGWERSGGAHVRGDHWNCDLYADDGRALLYKGAKCGPDSSSCLPYASTTSARHELYSAPIEIPSDAEQPTAFLAHQFSTSTFIDDFELTSLSSPQFRAENAEAAAKGRILVHHNLTLLLEEWDPVKMEWRPVGQLQPKGGFPTEASTGITHPNHPRFLGIPTVHETQMDDWPDPGLIPLSNCTGSGWSRRVDCRWLPSIDSWWWPQGEQRRYHPPDRALAVGETFHGGSPWSTDTIPLYGSHYGEAVDVRGKTVRLNFGFHSLNNPTPAPDRDMDWGWRLGGLAVIEGDRFERDITIQSAELDVEFDPLVIGVGPGSSLPLKVVVRNDGLRDVNAAQVRVHYVGDLIGDNEILLQGLCSGDRIVGPGSITREGGIRNVTHRGTSDPFACEIPDDVVDLVPPGVAPRLALRTFVTVGQDDFRGNVQERVRGLFPIQASPELFVATDVNIRDATVGTPRDLLVTLQNTGNIPLEDVEVQVRVCWVRDAQCLNRFHKAWMIDEALDVAQEKRLSHRLDTTPAILQGELTFTPLERGTYLLEAVVSAPGEEHRSSTRFDALDELYRENFDEPPSKSSVMDGDLEFTGTPDVWGLQRRSADGSLAIVAGDPATGDIPENTDASVVLPVVDLGLLKRATLSFNHRYDLEESFDAARIEISTDGGTTWEALVPRPQPLNNLPEGYPSTTLLGSSDLLGPDEVECSACVFTGSSEEFFADGWMPVEIDLTRHPAFWVTEDLESFRLSGMESHPGEVPTFNQEFRHETWILDEPNADPQDRYWWIHDATYSEPRPRDPGLGALWWSGSVFSEQPAPPVNTRLSFNIPQDWDAGGEEELVLEFWDWRAGWRGATDEDRPGTGGEYQVTINGQEAPVRVVERRPDGWTKRAVEVSDAGHLQVEFTYLSGQWPDIQLIQNQFEQNFTPAHRVWLAENQTNLGWFIDQVQLVRAGNIVFDHDASHNNGWTSTTHDDAIESVKWARVPLSFGETPPWAQARGWHVATTDHPVEGELDAWRFSSEDPKGYPANADSRLVTPRMDLRFYMGDTATFRFDHKYSFHGAQHSGSSVGRAVDGGTINYQVFDETTGTYGPWQSLTAVHDPTEVGFQKNPGSAGIHKWNAQNWELRTENSTHAHLLRAAGYSSIATVPPTAIEGFQLMGTVGGSIAFRPSHIYTTGFGSSFEGPSEGWIRLPDSVRTQLTDPEYPRHAFQPYPFVHVFSGNSTKSSPETDGWESEQWDISHLIGEQVRFSFHVWTSPLEEPLCGFREFWGLRWWIGSLPHRGQYCYQGENGDWFINVPHEGWTVANVGIQGQRFQGEEALIRFRLVTDESMTKGEWLIDDVQIAGEPYRDSLLFRAEERRLVDTPGTRVTFEGELQNRGQTLRDSLALLVDIRVDDELWTDYEILEPVGLDPVELSDLSFPVAGGTEAMGPFSLTQAGTEDSVLPIRLDLMLPDEDDAEVEVFLEVVEGVCDVDDVCWYEPVSNDRGSGLPFVTWTAQAQERVEFRFVPPIDGVPSSIVSDPPVAQVNESVEFSARILNNGTKLPVSDLLVDWTVQEILRKGDPGNQKHTQEILGEQAHHEQQEIDLDGLERGDHVPASMSFVPPKHGLYRVQAMVLADGQSAAKASLEIIVEEGEVEPIYRVDFAQTNATDAGWLAQGGRGPSEIAFRQVGPQLLWGVSPEQQNQGLNYCSFEPGCDTSRGQVSGSSNSANGEPPEVGYEGVAQSAELIDLGRIPGDRAVLTLRHAHQFDVWDGAVVEVLPLQSPVNPTQGPRPAFQCVDGSGSSRPMWFRLYPEPESGYGGTIQSFPKQQIPGPSPPPPGDWTLVPARMNPVSPELPDHPNEDPIPRQGIGGIPTDGEVIRFFLDGRTDPICPYNTDFEVPEDFDEEAPASLVNYTLEMRLRTGTIPGTIHPVCNNPSISCPNSPRQGAMGWQIDGMSITFVEASIFPDRRVVPMFDGFAKEFRFLLTNHGAVSETFRIEVDSQLSDDGVDPDWFSFPESEVSLLPGETRAVRFGVAIPEEPPMQRGVYEAVLRAGSLLDPNVGDTTRVDIDLREHELPDLRLQLEPIGVDETDSIPRFEEGKTASFRALVANDGWAGSEAVNLDVEAVTVVDNQTIRTPLQTLRVPALCGERGDPQCDEDDALWLGEFSWTVPDQVGTYWIEATVDPEGRLIQERLANSRASVQLQVIPLQRADVVVEDIRFDGIGEDGYALEGGFVTITANLTNRGPVVATGVQVQIEYAGEPLFGDRPVILDALRPGEVQEVSVVEFGLPAGPATVQVIVRPHGDAPWSGTELRRTLLVRGLDLALLPVEEPVSLAPGETGTTTVTLASEGNAMERVHLSLDPAHAGWGLQASPNPVTVAPNATAFSVIRLQAPPNAPAGEYELILHGAPQSHPGASQVTTIPVRVDAQLDAPRVQVDPLRAPPGPTELLVHVESRSNAPENVTVALADPDWGSTSRTLRLPANGNETVLLPTTIPAHTAPGPVPYLVHVVNGTGSDVARAHGSFDVTAHAAGTADWTDQIRSPQWDLQTRTFEFPANVTNTGNVPFVPKLIVTGLSDGTEALRQAEHPVIEPGETRAVPVALRVSSEFTGHVEGRLEVFMNLEPNDPVNATLAAVASSDTTPDGTNNTNLTDKSDNATKRETLDESLRIALLDLPALAALADLEVSRVSMRPNTGFTPDEPVQVSVSVRNAGFKQAPATELYAYVDGDFLTAYPVEPLAPGEETRINFTWSFPRTGEYLVYLLADGPNEVLEVHQDNNAYSDVIVVQPGGWTDRIQEAPGPAPLVVLLGLLAAALASWTRRRDEGKGEGEGRVP